MKITKSAVLFEKLDKEFEWALDHNADGHILDDLFPRVRNILEEIYNLSPIKVDNFMNREAANMFNAGYLAAHTHITSIIEERLNG